MGFFILEKWLASQCVFLVKSKHSIIPYLFLYLTDLQPHSCERFLKISRAFCASRNLWIIIVFLQHTLIGKLPFLLVNTLLLYIPLLDLTDGLTEWQNDGGTNYSWLGWVTLPGSSRFYFWLKFILIVKNEIRNSQIKTLRFGRVHYWKVINSLWNKWIKWKPHWRSKRSINLCMHKWDIGIITWNQSNNLHEKYFEYLIKKMQMCHFADEQWNNLKMILIDHRDGFTDDQWKTVFPLLSENRLNDEQFGLFCGYAWYFNTEIGITACRGGDRKNLFVNFWRVSFAQWNLLLHVSNQCGCFALTTRPYFPQCFQDMDTKFKCRCCNRWSIQVTWWKSFENGHGWWSFHVEYAIPCPFRHKTKINVQFWSKIWRHIHTFDGWLHPTSCNNWTWSLECYVWHY